MLTIMNVHFQKNSGPTYIGVSENTGECSFLFSEHWYIYITLLVIDCDHLNRLKMTSFLDHSLIFGRTERKTMKPTEKGSMKKEQ